MRDYKQWTAEQRSRSLSLTNAARRAGLLQGPTECRLCGQTKGILHTHNSNYDITLSLVPKMLDGTATEKEVEAVKEVLVPICWTCHMMLHRGERHPLSWEHYKEMVKDGYRPSPVYKRDDWGVLDKYMID